MVRVTTITFLLLSLSGMCYSENPGIKMRITDSALQTGVKYMLDTMISKNKGYQLPNMNGNVPSEEMKYEFTEIRIERFNCEIITTAWVPKTGLQISLKTCTATINCNWKIESWLINDSGSSVLTLDGISASVLLGIQQSKPGVPSISVLDCQSGVQGIDIKMLGGVSYVYDAMKEPMENLVREKINQQMCTALSNNVKKWDLSLGLLNLNLSLNSLVAVDLTPVGNPEITDHYADIGVKGRFYSANQTDTGFSPAPILFPVQQESMLYVGVSEASINSVCVAYFTAGLLSFNISQLPDSRNITTTELSASIPEISQAFPNPTPVKIQISATRAPIMYLKPNKFTSNYQWLIQAFAYPPKDRPQYLFSATVVTLFKANFSLSDAKGVPGLNLTGSVSLIRLQLDGSQSATKIPKSTLTEKEVLKLMNEFIVPDFNERIQKGIHIPATFLNNSNFSINEGFALVAADLNVGSSKV